jgi:Arc/MetJ-type ribon-helix-helix transcriptional regulator
MTPKTETLTVNLPVELVAQVRGAVEHGEYRSDNEAISDALLDWSARRGSGAEDTGRLRQAWREATEVDAPYVPMEEVFGRLKARYKAMIVPAAEK